MPTPPIKNERLTEVVDAIRAAGGSQIKAAKAMGLARGTLQSRLREAESRGLADFEDPRLVEKCRDIELRSFATVAQGEMMDAVVKHGSLSGAAAELSMSCSDVQRRLSRLVDKASIRGYSPSHDWTHPVPDTHVAKGVSTYYPPPKDAEGRLIGPAQWVKADLRQEAYNEMVRGAISEFLADVPRIDAPPSPLDWQDDVIPWVQIGDAHIGMLAHAAETGENFDLKIAERELCAAISILIDELPPCERIVINDLGDATHYDNMQAVTAASGHPLDADGRHPKMLRVYSRTMRFIVDKALAKARHVDVLINQGNHSRINDFWMRELLSVAYGHTGRVHVLDNDNVFIGYRMGSTLVMVHHSDKCPPARLVGVMTSDFRKDFGETKYHYIDTGHVHHHFVSKEHPSVVIESWNHLAARDKWAHESGYRSRRAISVVLRSRTYGEVGRRLLPIDAVRDRLEKAGHQAQPQAAGAYAV